MNINITQTPLTDTLKHLLHKGLGHNAISRVGFNGLSSDPIVFEIRDGKAFMGACVVQLFWGQLHIEYLFVEEKYRKKGLGQQLMDHAFHYGKDKGCTLAFVNTMSFEALEFYQKMGFQLEFKREGYRGGVSFCYLKKVL
jgi:ribosomal protein S18 acetylase RimI-like enzyme